MLRAVVESNSAHLLKIMYLGKNLRYFSVRITFASTPYF